jgi:hypothetical protein
VGAATRGGCRTGCRTGSAVERPSERHRLDEFKPLLYFSRHLLACHAWQNPHVLRGRLHIHHAVVSTVEHAEADEASANAPKDFISAAYLSPASSLVSMAHRGFTRPNLLRCFSLSSLTRCA